MRKILRHRRSFHQGFTLTELAIVLLVSGFIVGAIWVAAQTAWSNYQAYRASQQLLKVVQNVRDYYMNAQAFPAAGDITASLDGLNLIPTEMRRTATLPGNTQLDHPFNNTILEGAAPGNGSFHVRAMACPNPPGTLTCFAVQMVGLSQQPCIRLFEYVPVTNTDLGIVQVGISTNLSLQPNPWSITNPTAPITSAQTQTWCNTGVNNEVDWVFKLRN